MAAGYERASPIATTNTLFIPLRTNWDYLGLIRSSEFSSYFELNSQIGLIR